MPRLTQFSDAFWGSEFTSTAGLDALIQRMSDGKKMSRELEDYLRQRAKIEHSYSQDLIKLYKSMKMREVIGTLEKSWNCLKAEIEKMAAAHIKAEASFQKYYEDLKKFDDGQIMKKKNLEETMRKYQQNKNSLYSKCMSSKKNYVQKCQERDAAKNQYEANHQSVTITAKDLDKLRVKREKADEEKNKADTAYRNLLDTLENARIEWEKAMDITCEEFQRMEEARISFMREYMWMATNIDSLKAVLLDESSENIRLVLETCQIEEDISLFIEKFMTGQERPEKIVYEDFYANSSMDYNGKPHTHVNPKRAPQPLPSQLSRPQPPRSRPPDARMAEDSLYSTVDNNDPMYFTVEKSASTSSTDASIPMDVEIQNRSLERREDTVVSPMLYSGMFTVIHPYVAQNVSELTVTTGSKVKLVRRMKNGFIQVVEQGTTKYGLIPERVVQKCQEAQSQDDNTLLIDFS